MKHRAGLIEAVNSILFFSCCANAKVTDIVSTGQLFVDKRRLEKGCPPPVGGKERQAVFNGWSGGTSLKVKAVNMREPL